MKAFIHVLLSLTFALSICAIVTDGTRNQLFGNAGVTHGPTLAGGILVTSIQVQRDGKILALATFGATRLFRFVKDGTFDTGFANTGILTLTSLIDFGSTILLDHKDDIIIAGSNAGPNFAFVRVLHNGQVDTSFGTNGLATFNVGELETAALQDDGKILGAGANGSNAVMIRVLPTGDIDPSFPVISTTYSAQVPGSTAAHIYDMCVQSDGKIVVGGSVTLGGITRFFLARYLPSGSLDTTFGSSGVITTDVTPLQESSVLGVQVTGDGSILATGLADDSGNYCIARYTPEGFLDSSFATAGIMRTTFELSAGLRASKPRIQVDGKIVAVVRNALEMTVFRATPEGVLDRSFANSGSLITATFQEGRSLAINDEGEIFIGAQESDLPERAAVISLRVDSIRYGTLSRAQWVRYYNLV